MINYTLFITGLTSSAAYFIFHLDSWFIVIGIFLMILGVVYGTEKG